jgi:hypothetical protein
MKSQTTQSLFIGTFALLIIGALYFIAPTAQAARLEVRERNTIASTTNASSTEKVKKARAAKVDATCMSTAVGTREAALMSAWTGLNTDLTEAFTTRTTALVAAWQEANVSDQAKATKEAWKTWKDDKAAVHKTFKTARKAAWETFKKTAKAECKVTVPKEEDLEKASSDSVSI